MAHFLIDKTIPRPRDELGCEVDGAVRTPAPAHDEAPAPSTRPRPSQAGELWAEYFEIYEKVRAGDASQGDAFSIWGQAEQAGVDYGIMLAQSCLDSASLEEQLKVDTFVGWGNVYRAAVSAGIQMPYVTDPRNSGNFVLNFGSWYASPRGTQRYNDSLYRETKRQTTSAIIGAVFGLEK